MNIANIIIMNLRFIKHGSRSVNVQQLNKKQANKKEEKNRCTLNYFSNFYFHEPQIARHVKKNSRQHLIRLFVLLAYV